MGELSEQKVMLTSTYTQTDFYNQENENDITGLSDNPVEVLTEPDFTNEATSTNSSNTGESSSLSWRDVCLLGQAPLPKLTLPVTVDGIAAQALFDTGACFSLIHISLVKSLQIPMKPCEDRISGLGDNNVSIVLGSVTTTLELCGFKLQPSTFYVLSEEVQMRQLVVLAPDFFQINNIELDLHRRCVTLLNDNFTCDIFQTENSPYFSRNFRNVKCFSANAVTLQPNETKSLDIVTPISNLITDTTLYFDGNNEHCQQNSDVQCLDGLVTLNSNNLKIFVSNFSNKAHQLTDHSIMGCLHSIPEEHTFNSCLTSSGDEETWTKQKVIDSLHLDDYLTDKQKDLVHKAVYDSRSVLSTGDSDIGHASVSAHKIELYNYEPIYQRPRRFPEPLTREIERQCSELQESDIIEPSNSPWSSPVVPIKKKDGSIRLCIDYRRLNAVTKPDKFPLPNLADSIYGLSKMKYFTSLDLVRGYYQVPIEKESRKYTAFSTPHGHFQFKRLSFGLKNAPSAFQRDMQIILQAFPWKNVVVYIDDILIMSETFDEHIELLRRVLTTLEQHNVKIKPRKCEWIKKSVQFLGHIVSGEGLTKPREYIEKVMNFPRPVTVKDLRRFLGLINFQRKFIRHCSTIQQPLSKLTGGKGKKTLTWTPEMIESFEKLKSAMQEDISLSYPDYGDTAAPLDLWVDASGTGGGACLMQHQNNEDKIIAFASMTFTTAQRQYSTFERELVALRWGVRTFKSFLYGINFVIHTDHRPLVYLNNMKLVDSRLARTYQELAEFNYKIVYVPGQYNNAADTLSRIADTAEGDTSPVDYRLVPDGLLVVKEIPGGGDSLLESLYYHLQSMKPVGEVVSSVQQLREKLVDHLIDHPSTHKVILNKKFRKNLRLMRFPGQTPCLELIQVFANLYNVHVIVHFGLTCPIIYRPNTKPLPCSGIGDYKRLHLQCISGTHFNPVVETKGYDLTVPIFSDVTEDPSDVTDHAADMDEADEHSLPEHSVQDLECNTLSFLDNKSPTHCARHIRGHITSVTVNFNGQVFCALLDNGSEISLISKSVVDALGLTFHPDDRFLIRGLGPESNNTSPILGSLDLFIPIHDNFSTYSHTFAVVSDDIMPYCILFGDDYLNAHRIQLSFKNNYCVQTGVCRLILPLLESHDAVTHNQGSCLMNSVENNSLVHDEVTVDLVTDNFNDIPDLQNLSSLISEEEIIKMQKRTPQLKALISCLSRNLPTKEWPSNISMFKRHLSKLKIKDGVLYYVNNNTPTYVISFGFLIELTLVVHYKLAHIGRNKVQKMLESCVWHPSAYKVAQDVCVSCVSCQFNKVHHQSMIPPMWKIVTDYAFELSAVDLVQFPKTKQGYIGCLMFVDHYSKWLASVPIKNKKAETVAKALQYQILPYLPRVPTKILSDNGLEFSSQCFNNVLEEFGIEHIYTTPYKPSSNGLVERVNRTIGEFLRNLTKCINDWDEQLPKAVITYNNTYHTEIDMSPCQLLLEQPHAYVIPPISTKDKQTWREGNPNFSPYPVKTKVLKKSLHLLTGSFSAADKLKSRYEGPFEIAEVISNGVTYVLYDERTNKECKVHYTQIKKWHETPLYLQKHSYYQQLQEKDPQSDLDVDDTEDAVNPMNRSYGLLLDTDSSFTSSSEDETCSDTEDDLFQTSCPHQSKNFSGFSDRGTKNFSGFKTNSGNNPNMDSYMILSDKEVAWNISDIRTYDSLVDSASSPHVFAGETAIQMCELLNKTVSILEDVSEECQQLSQVVYEEPSTHEPRTPSSQLKAEFESRFENISKRIEALKSATKTYHNASRSEVLRQLRDSLTETPKSGYTTRSKGPVKLYPNVQQRTLEYTKT